MKERRLLAVHQSNRIDNIIPGIIGHRAFPGTSLSSSSPFLLLDHIGPQKMPNNWSLEGDGGDHPHRGFETMTFMFQGKMKHRDSLGNSALLNSGDVQLMNAGKGIIHGGDFYADSESSEFNEIQLWINNPEDKKLSEPYIQNLKLEEQKTIEEPGVIHRVISGGIDDSKPRLLTQIETRILHSTIASNRTCQLPEFESNNNTYVYLIKGVVSVEGKTINQFQLAEISSGKTGIKIEAIEDSELLIFSGKETEQEVVFGGPFVMNTEDEIEQAWADFKAGKFNYIKEK